MLIHEYARSALEHPGGKPLISKSNEVVTQECGGLPHTHQAIKNLLATFGRRKLAHSGSCGAHFSPARIFIHIINFSDFHPVFGLNTFHNVFKSHIYLLKSVFCSFFLDRITRII